MRRAGIFVIKLLLEGLGDDAFGVLQGIIRDIWKTLIAQRNSEPDEVQTCLYRVSHRYGDTLQLNFAIFKTIYFIKLDLLSQDLSDGTLTLSKIKLQVIYNQKSKNFL